jgi:hypothetical protein
MKIRTSLELQERLDVERSWRLREIADLKFAVRSGTGLPEKTIIRAGVPLLYAHWEGFVKQAALFYLTFVSSQRLRYDELTAPFVALGAKGHIRSLLETRKAELNILAVEFFLTKQAERANMSFAGAVDTESNLSSVVFENIATSIGIPIGTYQSKYNLIDESLLKRRNKIAHGEFLDIDATAFRALADEVLTLINMLKTDIENAASTRVFVRPPAIP